MSNHIQMLRELDAASLAQIRQACLEETQKLDEVGHPKSQTDEDQKPNPHILVSSEQTGNAFCVLRISASPGNVTPPHLHRTTDETFLIESGEVEVNLGGELLQGRPGDVIYLPKVIAHAPKVGGNDRLTVVVLCVPGGFDHFFGACAEEFKKGEPEMSTLIKLAGEYGIEFQSDPVR